MLIKNIALHISIILTLLISLFAFAYYYSTIELISNFFDLNNQPMSIWILNRTIFAISIGSIPLLSYIAWRKHINGTGKLLIIYYIISWIIMFTLCVIVFLFVEVVYKPPSPFLPKYVIWSPFPHFWDYILPITSVLTPLVLYFFNILRKNGNKKMDNNENESSSVIDEKI